MLYRDFMQKFRPLYAAPDVPGATGGASDGAAAAVTDAAPSSSAAAAASPAAAPVDAQAAAAPAVPELAAPAVPDSSPSLLEAATGKPKPEGDAAAAKPEAGAEVKKDEPAPADAKPDAKDAKPEGDKPKDDATKDKDGKTDPDKKDATAVEPPAPIKYEAFKLPDGLKLDDKKLQAFTEVIGAKQLPQEDAQKLIDLYVAERQQDAIAAAAEQRRVWNTLNDTWKTESRSDPEIGGSEEALNKSLSMGKAVIEEYLKPTEANEYLAHLRNNGMGNFRLHLKLMRNIGKALNIFEDGIVPANPQAPKATKGPGQRGWYDKSLNAPQ